MTNLLLYQRIAQQLAEDIRRGVYQPGERVPSVRKMSSQLNVSHATVLQAYANLEDQGLIRARPQSGYYVHQTPALTAPTPDIARVERPGLVTRSSIIQQVLVESRREGVFPLGAAVPSVDYLPVRALHQQLAKVTRFHSPRAFSYMHVGAAGGFGAGGRGLARLPVAAVAGHRPEPGPAEPDS